MLSNSSRVCRVFSTHCSHSGRIAFPDLCADAAQVRGSIRRWRWRFATLRAARRQGNRNRIVRLVHGVAQHAAPARFRVNFIMQRGRSCCCDHRKTPSKSPTPYSRASHSMRPARAHSRHFRCGLRRDNTHRSLCRQEALDLCLATAPAPTTRQRRPSNLRNMGNKLIFIYFHCFTSVTYSNVTPARAARIPFFAKPDQRPARGSSPG